MKYLVIENAGEIEPNAFSLMGASSKRGEDKIGMFGTGSKYALAVLLQAGIQPLVVSGVTKIRFGLQPAELKGRIFNQVVMQVGNKKTPLSFTTTMGLHWNVEHALRELVSNAIDEGGFTIGVYEGETYKPGTTRIFIPFLHEDVQKFYKNFGDWFVTADRKPVYVGENWKGTFKIYNPLPGGMRVYRRGVCVFSVANTTTLWDYDISWLDVREDRTSDKFYVMGAIAEVTNLLPNGLKISVLKHIEKNSESPEAESNAQYYVNDESWKEAIGTNLIASRSLAAAHPNLLQRADVIVLPDKWAEALTGAAKCPDAKTLFTTAQVKGYTVIPTEKWEPAYRKIFSECEEILIKLGLYDMTNLPVFEMFTGQKNTWGEYVPVEDKVLMNEDCFKRGKFQVFKMLLEELMHRKSGEGDFTREFQNAIFQGWAETVMKLMGEAI